MNILVIGHSYVVDSNRQFWNQVAQNEDVHVDIIVPRIWNSNLIQKLRFKRNLNTDSHFGQIFDLNCYFLGNASLYFFNWFAIFKIFFSKKYDLIFVFQETWSLSVAQVSLVKFFSPNRKTLYYLAVCQNIIKPQLHWVIPWEKLITLNIDRILYCTREIIEVLQWKKLNHQSSYFPFTYDQNIYDFKIKPINHDLVIGYLGRLTEEKGISCLVLACKKLRDEKLNIKLLLGGSGPLKETIKESFVEFVGPFKHNEAHAFYHQINLFVLPSETRKFWKEQFGRVIVEAVASGTPIVGSNSGAIPEVLSTLKLNYIFEEGDADDLALVIKTLIHDMKENDFEQKMIGANELNLSNFSHQSVGKNLLLQIREDLKKYQEHCQ